MATPPNSPTGPDKGKNELSMEKRLLIAFVLMGLVLFLTPYIYKPAPPPKQAPTAQQAAKNPAAAQAPAETKPVEAATPPPAAPGQIQETTEKLFTIDTDVYRIQMSNR